LVKLSKAADPWSSCLAAYYSKDGELFIWGMVDQTVHFNRQMVRESDPGGYAPPGLFQVVALGIADVSVYRRFGFVARLAQDTLLKKQANVFWEGPISDRIWDSIDKYTNYVWERVGGWEDDEYTPFFWRISGSALFAASSSVFNATATAGHSC
jgi:hypothetical protein